MTIKDMAAPRLEGIHNFRDLGGIALSGGGVTRHGRVFRSCALSEIDEGGRGALDALGIVRVIDLRSAEEIAARPGLLAAYPDRVQVALFERLSPVAELLEADPAADLGARYIAALDSATDSFAAAFSALAHAPEGPVVFHCTAGKDRTGLIAALMLDLVGASHEDITADYAATARIAAPLLDRLRQRALARGATPATVSRILRAEAPAMLRFLDHLSGVHGGSRVYLRAAGVQEVDLNRLGQRLTA